MARRGFLTTEKLTITPSGRPLFGAARFVSFLPQKYESHVDESTQTLETPRCGNQTVVE